MKQLLQSIKNNRTAQRFVGVGVVNTLIDFGVLFILQHIGIAVIVANIISTTTAFCFSFFANKRYTFQTTGTDIRREMLLFVVVTLTGMWVLQNIVIVLSMPMFSVVFATPVALLFAKLLATVFSLIWNYFLYKNVVFKHSPASEKGE